jgi:hypothetical protein
MLRVNQSRVGGFCRIVPLAGSGFPAGVLGGGDDLEVLIS